MSNPLNISNTDLLAVLPKVLNAPASDITLGEWSCRPMDLGGSQQFGGYGLMRVSGQSQVNGITQHWSFIIKAFRASSQMDDDQIGSWNYWKREFLVNQSGINSRLPAGIVAPKCYAAQERDDGVCLMWIESIQEDLKEWKIDEYLGAANCLGLFNGAYLCGELLPDAQPWLTWGRCHQWAEIGKNLLPQAAELLGTRIGMRWFPNNSFDRIPSFITQQDRLLNALDRLPVCFCHHDAFRRNLMRRTRRDGSSELVAIDWAISGFGRIGEEVGVTTGGTLTFMEVTSKDALLLDEAVFTGYIDGLRDAGWHGDSRLVRLGYTTCIGVLHGLTWPVFMLINLQSPEYANAIQVQMRRNIDEVIAAWRETTTFMLDRCEEAFTLVDELNLG